VAHTPHHEIRCPDELWDSAVAAAHENGTNLSHEIREFLKSYVAKAKRRKLK